MGTVIRQVVVSRPDRPRQSFFDSGNVQNLLNTTLAPQAPTQNPFSVDDWPNPVRARLNPVSNLTHIFYYVSDMNGPPSYNYDWPNPTGPQARNLNRGYEQVSPLALLSGPPPPPPFNGFTFENPLQPAWRKDLRFLVNFTTPPSQIIIPPAPFFGSAFPNPTLRKHYNQRSETVSVLANGQLQPLPPPNYFGGTSSLLSGVGR